MTEVEVNVILALMFPAYVERPKNCRFEGQDPGEHILLLLRAHPITNLPWMFLSVFVFAIPFIVVRFAPFIGFDLTSLPQNYLTLFLIIDYLMVLIIVFEGFLEWYFNATIITNEKIIDMSFAQILYKGVDLAPLEKIEETDSVTAGIVGTIFNYGNVKVQTAGANIAIEMHNIPRPALVADMILDLIGKPHQKVMPE